MGAMNKAILVYASGHGHCGGKIGTICAFTEELFTPAALKFTKGTKKKD